MSCAHSAPLRAERPAALSIPVMLLGMLFLGNAVSHAQIGKGPPTTWYPEPSTGLMWTGTAPWPWVNWQQANDSCASLRLGGFSDWRLPTLIEMQTATHPKYVVPPEPSHTQVTAKNSARIKGHEDLFPPTPYYALVFSGGIEVRNQNAIWTSTHDGPDSMQVVFMGEPMAFWGGGDPHFRSAKSTDKRFHVWVCTRSMEPELLQIANDAQVTNPVPDLLTLKAYVPLNKAKVAYKAGQFQDSIAQAQSAFAIKPDFAPGYWAIGLCYGRLGQWDQAISSFEAAIKIYKDYGDAKTGLKWAKDGQKAAKSGKQVKESPPAWN